MTYVLDTTIISELMRSNSVVRSHISVLPPSDRLVVCPITRGEILYGLERLPRGKRRRTLEAEAALLFASIPCVAVPASSGDHYAKMKREAERKGTPVDENDLWIAATARSLNATLATADNDFRRITDLSISDWTK